jgi:hypothetical protein
MICKIKDIWNMDANITVEDAESGLPVAMKYLIAAIVTMRQKMISTWIISIDMTCLDTKSNR